MNGHSKRLANNPLLHPKSSQPFSKDLFLNPTAEYRGTPLWSWNNKLDPHALVRQIDHFETMGLGGFHMHSRVGLDTPYMQDEFMHCVKICVAAAKDRGMLAYLYDEDRWPSGAAGGLVTKGHPELGARHLLLTTKRYGEMENPRSSSSHLGSAVRSEDGKMVAKYFISEAVSKSTYTYRRVGLDDSSIRPGETAWYAYVEGNPPSAWYNSQTYIDTLNPKAIQRFIELTHEKYKATVGEEFGTTVPSIFCDEPQFSHKAQLLSGERLNDLFFPWSDDLTESFSKTYFYDVLDHLPAIVWDTPQSLDSPPVRYHYHDHVCERFVSAFMDQLSSWCASNGLALTGHMMQEPTLRSQTETLGEAMRCYRNLDVPGIDILHDAVEFNTAKQAVSVSRQRNGGRGRAMSEMYGVTNWTFDFTGYKGQGDWQMALGITLRVPHLSPATLAGEGKRDYPAAISYQAPWFKEWKVLEDHFSRVATALTRGKAVTRVAVIHPIESFWTCFGPLDRNADEQVWRLAAFDQLSEWLLHGLVDFDFISESLLPGQASLDELAAGKGFVVGECEYDIVILPNLSTIRSTTLERLQKFAELGGRVIIAGSEPIMVDARVPTTPPKIESATHIEFNQYQILKAVESVRHISIFEHWGTRTESLLYQLREDGDDRYLFVCNIDRKKELNTTITVKGEWAAELLDTLSGETRPLAVDISGGQTTWPWIFLGASSLLVRLHPSSGTSSGTPQSVYRKEYVTIASLHLNKMVLTEPNVLLLDRAIWRLDADTEWQPEEEILRLDNLARKKLGLPLRTEQLVQPWSLDEEDRAPVDQLHLRYSFVVDEDIVGPISLAIEDSTAATISLDSEPIPSRANGWWVDEEIHTIPLLASGEVLAAGTHQLDLKVRFGRLTNVERIYVLGDFGVDLRGTETRIVSLDTSRLRFGDWTRQGLPFYAGSVEYHCSFTLPPDHAGSVAIDLPHYEGPLVTATLDDSPSQPLFMHPAYTVFDNVSAGEHKVILTAYGNRENAFGTVHLPSGKTKWHGPNAWRYEHDWWCDEYNVKPLGIIQASKVKVKGKEDVVTVRRSKVQKWYN